MTSIGKVIRLAEMKAQAKDLAAEIKSLEKELIAEGAGDKFNTDLGTLTLTTRETWECTSNELAIKEVSQEFFNEHATLSRSAVKKQLGELRVEMLDAIGIFRVKSVSKFFTFRGKK